LFVYVRAKDKKGELWDASARERVML